MRKSLWITIGAISAIGLGIAVPAIISAASRPESSTLLRQ